MVSVDTKKKELVGPFKNAGREWRPRGDPERVRVHDFPDSALGKAIPYGVYDLTRDAGWVSVGVDHDTAAFAVETLRRWWWRMGCVSYPAARRLLITADGGGSNGSRNRLWKWELQKLSDETGLSKWNKPSGPSRRTRPFTTMSVPTYPRASRNGAFVVSLAPKGHTKQVILARRLRRRISFAMFAPNIGYLGRS